MLPIVETQLWRDWNKALYILLVMDCLKIRVCMKKLLYHEACGPATFSILLHVVFSLLFKPTQNHTAKSLKPKNLVYPLWAFIWLLFQKWKESQTKLAIKWFASIQWRMIYHYTFYLWRFKWVSWSKFKLKLKLFSII